MFSIPGIPTVYIWVIIYFHILCLIIQIIYISKNKKKKEIKKNDHEILRITFFERIIFEIISRKYLILTLLILTPFLYHSLDLTILHLENNVLSTKDQHIETFPIHISHINSFLYGSNQKWPPRLPELLHGNQRFDLTIIPTLHTSLLIAGGFTTRNTIIIETCLCLFSLLIFIHSLTLRIISNRLKLKKENEKKDQRARERGNGEKEEENENKDEKEKEKEKENKKEQEEINKNKIKIPFQNLYRYDLYGSISVLVSFFANNLSFYQWAKNQNPRSRFDPKENIYYFQNNPWPLLIDLLISDQRSCLVALPLIISIFILLSDIFFKLSQRINKTKKNYTNEKYHNSNINNKLLNYQTVFIASITTGIMSITVMSENKFPFQSNQDVEVGQWIKENTEPNSIFLIKSNFFAVPPLLVSGRQLIRSSQHYCENRGIDLDKLESTIDLMLGVIPNTSIDEITSYYDFYNIKYIFSYLDDGVQLQNFVKERLGFIEIYHDYRIVIYKKIEIN
ncbi:stress response protein nst1 [Anaeramoeba flamelloides]|uniref:Stress response protein nst1 n=1 Tax=Anaeramoeba flamelloides TaxID=1746091 RepID=A0AAV7YMD8_9EUKA|nr:stress response protein nst1 [Anaeramoeba flamelloides]